MRHYANSQVSTECGIKLAYREFGASSVACLTELKTRGQRVAESSLRKPCKSAGPQRGGSHPGCAKGQNNNQKYTTHPDPGQNRSITIDLFREFTVRTLSRDPRGRGAMKPRYEPFAGAREATAAILEPRWQRTNLLGRVSGKIKR